MRNERRSGAIGRLHSSRSIPLHYVPLHTAASIATSNEMLLRGQILTSEK